MGSSAPVAALAESHRRSDAARSAWSEKHDGEQGEHLSCEWGARVQRKLGTAGQAERAARAQGGPAPATIKSDCTATNSTCAACGHSAAPHETHETRNNTQPNT